MKYQELKNQILELLKPLTEQDRAIDISEISVIVSPDNKTLNVSIPNMLERKSLENLFSLLNETGWNWDIECNNDNITIFITLNQMLEPEKIEHFYYIEKIEFEDAIIYHISIDRTLTTRMIKKFEKDLNIKIHEFEYAPDHLDLIVLK